MTDLIARLTGGLLTLAHARTRPVDLIMIGDSNQLYGGNGFDFGLGRALAKRFGMYATPLYNQQAGGGDAYALQGHASSALSSATGAASGAPSAMDDFRLPQRQYLYQASGAIGASNSGVNVSVESALPYSLDVNANLRAYFGYGTFSGAGSFRPEWRRNSSPFNSLGTAPSAISANGADGQAYATLDLAAGVRDYALLASWQITHALVGPMVELWQRVENRDRQSGISASTLYGEAGQSLYDMAAAIAGLTDARLQNYLRQVTLQQRLRGLPPMAVVYVNSGFNDRNETSQPSLGPVAGTVADSALNYIDNLEALRVKLDAAWVACGYDLQNLTYLIIPSHPISDPDDAEVVSYRSAVSRYVAGRSRFAFLDLASLITSAQMTAGGYYDTGNIHLLQAGYTALGELIVDQVP